MEELLRNYFLKLGYFVTRGVKYSYEENEITDIDLYLYNRSSSITRERINVDIKNKKSPQAFERILWANGLKILLGFDKCIVATTDSRPVINKYGNLHHTTVLDGKFLAKIRVNSLPHRLTEEEILIGLSKIKSYKTFENKNWKFIYEDSKTKLLTENDFSGFNSLLTNLFYFIEKAISDIQKRPFAVRMIYLTLSHLLIVLDYILKDIAFLETTEKEKKLSDGFKFGNLGKGGVDKIISMAVAISGKKSAGSILKSMEGVPAEILKDFFAQNENAKKLFHWAISFEDLGYRKDLVFPENIDSSLKGVLALFLDFFKIERKKFFSVFPKHVQKILPLEVKRDDGDQK